MALAHGAYSRRREKGAAVNIPSLLEEIENRLTEGARLCLPRDMDLLRRCAEALKEHERRYQAAREVAIANKRSFLREKHGFETQGKITCDWNIKAVLDTDKEVEERLNREKTR